MTEKSKIQEIEEKYGDENHDSILADLLTDEELATTVAGIRNTFADKISLSGGMKNSTIDGGPGTDSIYLHGV